MMKQNEATRVFARLCARSRRDRAWSWLAAWVVAASLADLRLPAPISAERMDK